MSDATDTAVAIQNATEHLIAISTAHLHVNTRTLLEADCLPICTYGNEYGGFVYVDQGPSGVAELDAILNLVRPMGVVWIKFDRDAAVIPGLATFPDVEPGQ